MNNTSRTDWARIDAMTDEDIDTLDIPPLTDAFFERAKLRMPRVKIADMEVQVTAHFSAIADFADDDRAMAEAGMDDYAVLLAQEH